MSQHAGESQWKAQIRFNNEKLDIPFNGTNPKYPFMRHAINHRTAYANVSKAAKHVPYQEANDTSKCTTMFQTIEGCKDPTFLSGVAECKRDPAKHTNFETMLAYLNQFCPVNKTNKNVEKKRKAALISSATGKFGDKKVLGPETGVELRYYTFEEFKRLTDEQKKELKKIRDQQEESGGTRHLSPNRTKKGKGKDKVKSADDAINASTAKKLIASEVAKINAQINSTKEEAKQGMEDFAELCARVTQSITSDSRATVGATVGAAAKTSISTAALLERIKKNQVKKA